MNIRDFIRKNDLLYETCNWAIQPIKIFKIRRRNKAFEKMTIDKLVEIDAKMYLDRQGVQLNWSELKTYTEKMQWEKIFNQDSQKSLLTDKYGVRKWVENRIGREYLIPLIGVWKRYEDIDFSKLPESFVMKTNHGSNDVVIIRDKSRLTLAKKLKLKRVITTSMITNYAYFACEMHYAKIEPLIIAEKLIESDDIDLQDYKFLCFDGIPYFCWVDVGRYTDHKRNIYNMNWELQSWNQYHYGNTKQPIDKPKNFEKMIEIVKILSAGFSHVRVDLYNVGGKIYFGEMTFTNGSGFEEITPNEINYYLGSLWKLDMN